MNLFRHYIPVESQTIWDNRQTKLQRDAHLRFMIFIVTHAIRT